MSEIGDQIKQATELAASLSRDTKDFGVAAETVAKLEAVIKNAKGAIAAIESKVLDAALNGVDVTQTSTSKKFKVTKGKTPYFLPSKVWEWLKGKQVEDVVIHYRYSGVKTTATIADMEKRECDFYSKQGEAGLKTEDAI